MIPRREIHLAVRLPVGDEFDFDSCVHLARTAERGRFDFVLVDGDLVDGIGQPDTFTLLSALAAVTDRLGLVGAVDTTAAEPFEVARQLATLDHLSDGRVGWFVEMGVDPRAHEFLTVVRAFWDSWDVGAVQADEVSGIYADPERIHAVQHHGAHFDVTGVATLPAGPQGHPVLLQASRFRVAPVAGSAAQVAAEIDRQAQSDACEGFILDCDGLDEFVDSVVPLLQEFGSRRTGYASTTLRGHLR